MAKIIMLADNNIDYLNTRAELLEANGYSVIKASSPDEARKVFAESYIHLALLDIRLIEDDDDKDLSGIHLAKEESNRNIPKIIITDYPSYDYVRAALGPSVEGLPIAVDFVYKKDNPDAMIEAIEQVFTTHLQINENLHIGWDDKQPLSFPGLVAKIEGDLPATLLVNRVQEMEDLYRRLFNSSEQITFIQQLWNDKGRALLELLAYTGGKEESMLVTVGLREQVNQEQARFHQYASGALHAGSLAAVRLQETVHYAAVAWSMVTNGAAAVEGLMPFTVYYRSHTEKQARSVLENLFQNTLKAWVGHAYWIGEQPLDKVARLVVNLDESSRKLDELNQRMLALVGEALQRGLPELVFSTDKLEFRFANGRNLNICNPLPFLCGNRPLPKLRAVFGASLGGLDPDKLLIDRLNRIWISDFARLGSAPVWLDAVNLECELRFRQLDTGNLQELYELEKCLLRATRLGENVSLDEINPDFHKAATCIQTIRSQAAAINGDELAPYETGLLFLAAQELVGFDPQHKRRGNEIEALIYRLLMCGLLAEKLYLDGENADQQKVAILSPEGLLIDESNHEVTVGGKPVELTPREYDLLLYLYRQRDRLCKRVDIIRDVFNSDEGDDNLLDTNISRLRRKIKSDTYRQISIETIRGMGFKLVLPQE